MRAFGGPTGEEELARRFPKLAGAVTDADRKGAAWENARVDGNGDGVITEVEWEASGYQPGRFKSKDLDGDGRLALYEHTLVWVQWRLGRAQQPAEAAGRPAGAASTRPLPLAGAPQSQARQRQTQELAAYTLPLYDRNRNGIVDHAELQSTTTLGNVAPADADHDGTVTQHELAAWLLESLESQFSSGLPQDVPAWFLTSDFDRDGQVQLSEFLRTARGGPVAAFERYDRNGDGFVTIKELATPTSDGANRYASSRPHIIEPERETFTQLLVTEDLLIADINVQLSIAKNGDDDLELQLIGPDGARAMLYFDNKIKPWGGGRLFENTLLDDEAPDIPQRLVRPPLHRSFRPQGMKAPGMQGLKAFYNKPARGIWQLAITNKSQVAGLLEGWALLIKPGKGAPPRTARP